MLDYFRFRRLNSFLNQARITCKPTECIRFDIIGKQQSSLFDLGTEQGRRNYTKVINMLYDRYPAAIRIKLLILIHHLISESELHATFFLDQPRQQFKGVTISKKRLGYTEPCGDFTVRNQETSVSVSRVCITKRSIDDAVDFSDVNTYLHVYLVQTYLGYVMKLAANYDLYDQCRQITEIRRADFPLIWKLINMLKTILQVKVVLTHIGRYYFSQHLCIVSFIEMLTRNLTLFYRMLEHHITTALDSYLSLNYDQTENLLGILDEILELNENLYEIYYNRYFSKLTKHIPAPNWITLENDEADTIYNHFRRMYGEVRRTDLREPGNKQQERTDRKMQDLDEIQIPLN